MNEDQIDQIKRAMILQLQPGDILVIEVEKDFEMEAGQAFFKFFEERGIPVLVHDSTVKEFRVARKSWPEIES